MKPLDVLVAYNEPTLAADDPDRASEAGVLNSVEAVSAALVKRGHQVRRLGIESPQQLIDALHGQKRPEVVFNLFEGFAGVGRGESEVAGLFELVRLPLTGSASACLASVRDKPRTKWLLAGAGIATAPFEVVWEDGVFDRQRMSALLDRGPVLVKPAHEDGSLGIDRTSIVADLPALEHQVERVRGRYGRVLVEQFVVGREFNAAIVALPNAEVLPVAEIEFCGDDRPGWQIVTYESKWSTASVDDLATPARCPAGVDEAVAERIRGAALAAFRWTGCRHYARVDLRMDAQGSLFVLEVNANPDIDPSAGFSRALAAAGLPYEEFIDRMVRVAAARQVEQRSDAHRRAVLHVAD